jgi:hypothetical protein
MAAPQEIYLIVQPSNVIIDITFVDAHKLSKKMFSGGIIK